MGVPIIRKMDIKRLILIALAFFSLPVLAQWRIGITAGPDYNFYSRNNHYMKEIHYSGAWGATTGIVVQKDFTNWLSLRTELNWILKNHQEEQIDHENNKLFDTHTWNHYIQLPFMASFNYGSKKMHGFFNAGLYGGYWIHSSYWGRYVGLTNRYSYPVGDIICQNKRKLDSDYDQRFDYGIVGGIGIEYRSSKHWAYQIESRIYYSGQNTQKENAVFADPRYNTTLSFQATIIKLL